MSASVICTPTIPAAATDPWFILIVEPNRDSRAMLYLKRGGFDVRCLKILQRKSRRQPERVEVLMFPGYVFIRDPGDRWGRALKTFSVVDALRIDGKFAPLPDRAVAALFSTIRTVDDKGYAVVNMGGPEGDERPTYPPGTAIRITGGTFEGLSGHFKSRLARNRIQALLSLFGRETPVELDEDQIEVVDG